MQTGKPSSRGGGKKAPLSLYILLDPQILADPYPLYHRLRTEDPVHWDPYLHTWIVTRYEDVLTVLQHFSASRTPTPEQLTAMGLPKLVPFAEVLIRQMLFLDPPAHGRIRLMALESIHTAPGRSAALAHPGYYKQSPGCRAGQGVHGCDR